MLEKQEAKSEIKILAHQVKITDKKLPAGWNFSSLDFINRLLKRNK